MKEGGEELIMPVRMPSITYDDGRIMHSTFTLYLIALKSYFNLDSGKDCTNQKFLIIAADGHNKGLTYEDFMFYSRNRCI